MRILQQFYNHLINFFKIISKQQTITKTKKILTTLKYNFTKNIIEYMKEVFPFNIIKFHQQIFRIEIYYDEN